MIDYTSYLTGNQNDVLVLELTGRLNEQTSAFLFDCLDGHIQHGRNKLILDCTELEHIVSAGLGTLVRVHFRVKDQGGQVRLVGVQGVVAEIVRLVHFEKIFHLHDTVEEALACIESSRGHG